LVRTWQQQEVSNATIKNRLSQIRFLAQSFNKPELLAKSNHELNVGKRDYIARENKAIYAMDATKINDPLVRCSVRLQQHFGLRREESIKFIASQADEGGHIRLQPSWTKGGIGRLVPVVTPEQRALLNEVKAIAGLGKALIPDDKTYIYQRNVYDHVTRQAGYKNLHGLRHAYAQKRYYELTRERSGGEGWQAPFNGGISQKELPPAMRCIDEEVRQIIARELGHSRMIISQTYLGA
jgi:integrase